MTLEKISVFVLSVLSKERLRFETLGVSNPRNRNSHAMRKVCAC